VVGISVVSLEGASISGIKLWRFTREREHAVLTTMMDKRKNSVRNLFCFVIIHLLIEQLFILCNFIITTFH